MEPTKDPAATPLPARVGEFAILREIGRGGMGVVYAARQDGLEREVALKVVARTTLGAEQLERFEREARTASQLHHTNIVPVFAVGQVEDAAYYAMQLIHGESLDEILAALAADEPAPCPRRARFADGLTVDELRMRGDDPVRWHAAARLILPVADALAHAHAQGVLHRDVKPANLLLDERGTPWLTDFGLARRELDPQLTRSGEVVGTLQYLAPEALRGRYDERSDLYALGMTFYELLTWRPPFENRTPAELLADIARSTPRPPRSIVPGLPRDLETIVQTAIAPVSEHRYADVEAFRRDVEAFLEGRPIAARRVHAGERLVRWARRNPALAALLGTVALLLLLVVGIAAWGYVQTDRQRAKAEANLRLALEAFEEVFAQVGPGGRLAFEASFVPAEGEEEIAFPPIVSPDYVHVLEKLLGFYGRFAAANADDPQLRLDMARAHRRVGDIQLHFGRFDVARTSLDRALAVYEELAGGGLAYGEERVELLDRLGWLERTAGEREAALVRLDQAGDLLDALERAGPWTRALRLAKVRLATQVSTTLPMRLSGENLEGRLRGFLARRDAALALARELVAEDARDPEAVLALARLLRVVRSRRGEGEASGDEPRREAIALLEGLVRERPQDPEPSHELALTLAGHRLTRRGTLDPAGDDELERAVAIDERLVASYPTVPRYALALAQHRLMLGDRFVAAGDPRAARAVFSPALDAVRLLATRHPGTMAYDLLAAELGTRLGVLALADATAGEDAMRTSARELERARDLCEDLANERGGVSRRAMRLIVEQYDGLGRAYDALGESEAREQAVRERAQWEAALEVARPPRGRGGPPRAPRGGS